MGQRFVACDRDQSFLMPADVRDWLPEGHLAWFVPDAVSATNEPTGLRQHQAQPTHRPE